MMYSVKETADIFGVHWQTVRNWIQEGRINAIKIGNCIRIDAAEIERVKTENKYDGG